MPPLSSARVSPPTTLFATPACAAEIWSPCRALVALGIWVSSLRGTWDSILLQSGVDARRKSLRGIWARTSTSILPSTMLQHRCGIVDGSIDVDVRAQILRRQYRRGREKEKHAKDLGAHVYIDTAVDDAAAVLQRMGGARAILATAPSGDGMGPLVSGLAARGKLIVVGVPQDLIQLNAFPLVFGGRSIYGSLTGTPIDSEDTLAFSVLENIRPMIETVALEQAADAYARMMQGKARFRMVLVTKEGVARGASVNG